MSAFECACGCFSVPLRIAERYGMLTPANMEFDDTLQGYSDCSKKSTNTELNPRHPRCQSSVKTDAPLIPLTECRLCRSEGRPYIGHSLPQCSYLTEQEIQELLEYDKQYGKDEFNHMPRQDEEYYDYDSVEEDYQGAYKQRTSEFVFDSHVAHHEEAMYEREFAENDSDLIIDFCLLHRRSFETRNPVDVRDERLCYCTEDDPAFYINVQDKLRSVKIVEDINTNLSEQCASNEKIHQVFDRFENGNDEIDFCMLCHQSFYTSFPIDVMDPNKCYGGNPDIDEEYHYQHADNEIETVSSSKELEQYDHATNGKCEDKIMIQDVNLCEGHKTDSDIIVEFKSLNELIGYCQVRSDRNTENEDRDVNDSDSHDRENYNGSDHCGEITFHRQSDDDDDECGHQEREDEENSVCRGDIVRDEHEKSDKNDNHHDDVKHLVGSDIVHNHDSSEITVNYEDGVNDICYNQINVDKCHSHTVDVICAHVTCNGFDHDRNECDRCEDDLNHKPEDIHDGQTEVKDRERDYCECEVKCDIVHDKDEYDREYRMDCSEGYEERNVNNDITNVELEKCRSHDYDSEVLIINHIKSPPGIKASSEEQISNILSILLVQQTNHVPLVDLQPGLVRESVHNMGSPVHISNSNMEKDIAPSLEQVNSTSGEIRHLLHVDKERHSIVNTPSLCTQSGVNTSSLSMQSGEKDGPQKSDFSAVNTTVEISIPLSVASNKIATEFANDDDIANLDFSDKSCSSYSVENRYLVPACSPRVREVTVNALHPDNSQEHARVTGLLMVIFIPVEQNTAMEMGVICFFQTRALSNHDAVLFNHTTRPPEYTDLSQQRQWSHVP